MGELVVKYPQVTHLGEPTMKHELLLSQRLPGMWNPVTNGNDPSLTHPFLALFSSPSHFLQSLISVSRVIFKFVSWQLFLGETQPRQCRNPGGGERHMHKHVVGVPVCFTWVAAPDAVTAGTEVRGPQEDPRWYVQVSATPGERITVHWF